MFYTNRLIKRALLHNVLLSAVFLSAALSLKDRHCDSYIVSLSEWTLKLHGRTLQLGLRISRSPRTKPWGMIKIAVKNIAHIPPRAKQMYSSTYFGSPHHLFSIFYKVSECLETSVRLHWDKAHLGLFSFLVVVLKWS